MATRSKLTRRLAKLETQAAIPTENEFVENMLDAAVKAMVKKLTKMYKAAAKKQGVTMKQDHSYSAINAVVQNNMVRDLENVFKKKGGFSMASIIGPTKKDRSLLRDMEYFR